MLRYNSSDGQAFDLHRACAVAVLVACLGLGGCSTCSLGGPKYDYDPMADYVGHARQPDGSGEFSGVSNKARQIEQNLGIGSR